MGTKIEYYINLLATTVDSNDLPIGGVDFWEHYQNKGQTNNRHRTGIKKLQDPMDGMLDRNNIESIKKTMQMHEDIFKHQVRELHRVYSVQKMVMDDLKKEIRQQKFRTRMNGIDVSHPRQHQTTQTSYGPNLHGQFLREDLGSRERSGSYSGDTIKMQRGLDLERPAEEDIFTGEEGPSSYAAFQSCKISTGGSDEEMEVDLTLSIGCRQIKKSHPSQLACLNSSASLKSDRVGECSDPTTPISSSSVTFSQERKGPQLQCDIFSGKKGATLAFSRSEA